MNEQDGTCFYYLLIICPQLKNFAVNDSKNWANDIGIENMAVFFGGEWDGSADRNFPNLLFHPKLHKINSDHLFPIRIASPNSK